MSKSAHSKSGSYLVAVGAALWSIDSLFRSRLASHYPAVHIVFITQIISMFIILPMCWRLRIDFRTLSRRDWLAFVFLAIFSNILAMVAFTYSFAHAANYSTPVLIQKLQPLISVLSAVFLLKEELPKHYFVYAAFALVGSLLVGFGDGFKITMGSHESVAVGFALLAALMWGIGTTVGRFVSIGYSFVHVTVIRYAISQTVILVALPFWATEIATGLPDIAQDLPLFAGMALIPGLLALFIYYRGLQAAKANVACWLELAYPIAAVVVNWIFLGSPLSAIQILGGSILLISVTTMTYNQHSGRV